MLEKKQNVFDDFIAASEWLIANRYTSASRLAIQGVSNGGLLVAAALTQRPDLYRAVLCGFPDLDMVGYYRFPNNNPPALLEYGDASKPEQFPFLYAYSPYQKVTPGVRYPAVLLTTGDADTRVPPLQARKMTARLQAATTSGWPVLLRYDTKAGHAGGRPIGKIVEDESLELAFLVQQLGMEPPVRPAAQPMLLFSVALGVTGWGCRGGPGNGRGASLGGFGPAVTTPVADVTATVFVLELSLPEGLSRADAEAAETRALQREAAELKLKVTETKVEMGLVEKTRWSRGTVTLSEERFQSLGHRGSRVVPGTEIRRSTSRGVGHNGQPVDTHSYTVTVESPTGRYEVVGRPRAEAEKFWAPALREQRAALAALPPPEVRPPGRLEVRERWRYVTVSPPVPQLEEVRLYTKTSDGQFCRACADIARKRHALYLSSLGAPGVDPATLPPGALDAGIEIEGHEVVFGGADEDNPIRVGRPSDGRLTLRRTASCPARVVRVEDTPIIHWGSDVIAWPRREDQTWHELRDAACARTVGPAHEVFGPSRPLPPDTAKNPARFWIEEHRAELARLDRGEFKQPLP